MSESPPPASFYFELSIVGQTAEPRIGFKEVSGISMEMGAEEITEGGENRFKHRVPTAVKYSNLVLKRGLMPQNSEIAKWCIETLSGNMSTTMETKTIIVSLLNEKGSPLKSWNFINAWPVKWAVSDLNSMSSEIIIETLEFAYSYFTSSD
jgi:phage tail-like protein